VLLDLPAQDEPVGLVVPAEHRYNAACCALRAAAGKDGELPKVEYEKRGQLTASHLMVQHPLRSDRRLKAL
jgi:hypothetical protein